MVTTQDTAKRKVLLEICCGSVEDAVAAESGGADRVELCSALFLGGLTPSLGMLVETRRRVQLPVMCMVRPRNGGFCYSPAELEVMEYDVDSALQRGADGIVLGILQSDGTIDRVQCRRMRDRMGNGEAVFHRAFDVTPDPFRALEELIDLGFSRILTSGQQNSVTEGAELIRGLIEQARGRIGIMPGGGLHLRNLEEMIARTGCSQVHLSALGVRDDPSTLARPGVTFGGALYPSEVRYEVTDQNLVNQISNIIASSFE